MIKPFINIYRTKEEAFYFKNSPINSQYLFTGVQLLPNNPAKYVQITDTQDGIILEDWTVNAVDLCKGTKTDITDYFLVEVLTNSENGDPQFYWSLKDVPFDFGYNFIYLEITQAVGETFYSNPFMLTEIDSELTTQFHYKENRDDVYQSIQLQSWYYDEDLKSEIELGYVLSAQQDRIKTKNETYLHIFRTELISKNIAINLAKMVKSPVLYLDYTRYYCNDVPEIPKKQGQENFCELEFSLSPDVNDNFFGLADYSGIDYGYPDYNTDTPTTPLTKIHSSVYSNVYN